MFCVLSLTRFFQAGTGSEATGVSIFDHVERNSKTGIAHRRLKPTLGIVDPENIKSMPYAPCLCSRHSMS